MSQDFLVSQDALGSMVPMHQDLQAFLVYLGRKDPPVFQVPRDLQVLQAKRAHQEWPARKAVLVMWASQDPRGAKETLGPSVCLASLAWLDPLGQLDPQDLQGLQGHQDQDLLLDSMIWKALEYPSGQQPEALMGCRDLPGRRDSRGILEWQAYLEPREKLEQMEPRASLVPQEEKVQLDLRGQKERKGCREKRETQEKMEWAGRASLGLQDLQGL